MANDLATIDLFMSALPHEVSATQTLAAARAIMRHAKVRHLPVTHGGRVVGIVSQRDLDFVESLAGIDPERALVDSAMSRDPFCVAPDTPLADVAAEMAARRIGCAIVVDGARLVGIFTTVDGMRVLADVLHAHPIAPDARGA